MEHNTLLLITTLALYNSLWCMKQEESMDIPKDNSPNFELIQKTIYQTKSPKIVDCSFFPGSNMFVTLQMDKYHCNNNICLYKKDASTARVALLIDEEFLKKKLTAVSCAPNKVFAVLDKRDDDDRISIFNYEKKSNAIMLISQIYSTYQNISTIAWHPKGTYLACSDGDYCHIMKNDYIKPSSHSCVSTLHVLQKALLYRNGIAWSSDGSYLVTGPQEKYFGNTNACNIAFHFNVGHISLEVHNPTKVRPDIIKISKKNEIAFTGGKSIGFYKGNTKEIVPLKGHTSKIIAIAFDSTGEYLASADENNTLLIWNTETHTVCAQHTMSYPITSLAWHPYEKEIIVGMNGEKENDMNSSLVGLTLKKLMPITTLSKDSKIENNK